jgi:transposase
MQTDGVRPKPLLGDKGYDSDAIREDSWFHGTDPGIPTKLNRQAQRPVDPVLYALRNRIDLFVNRLKNAWRLATRYDTAADNFMAFIRLAPIKI